jgi:transcription initiation factor IIE alpha subunit
VRSVASLFEARAQEPADEGRKEKEVLEALARHGELTPARAALETSLGVAEADRVLSGLAKDGHIGVRAREGRLEYALWDADRRELME